MENQPQGGAPSTPPQPEMQTPKTGGGDTDQTMKIVGLIINIVILPGLGTIIMKKMKTGIIQLVLALVGWVLIWTVIGVFVGVPLIIIAWIWALITSIKAFKE